MHDINRNLYSKWNTHTSPLRASYWVSIVRVFFRQNWLRCNGTALYNLSSVELESKYNISHNLMSKLGWLGNIYNLSEASIEIWTHICYVDAINSTCNADAMKLQPIFLLHEIGVSTVYSAWWPRTVRCLGIWWDNDGQIRVYIQVFRGWIKNPLLAHENYHDN